MTLSELENVNFEPLNPINYPGWDKLLETNSVASFFHSSIWSKVLADTYKYKPLYFTTLVDGQMQCLIPMMEVDSILTGRRGVSLPFSDYCEPIISEQHCVENAVESLVNFGRKAGWKYFELRIGGGLPEDWPVYKSFYGHRLSLLQDSATIFSGLKRTVKQNINKAQRKEVQVEEGSSLSSLKEYYRLNCVTRKRHGLPPQPFSFFKSIFDNIISQKLGLVLLAYYKNIPIAGGMFFQFDDKVIYKYNALDKKFQDLRPNDLITWWAIKRFCKEGFKNFSFGRTETSNEGLRRFKKGWGVEESIIRYYRYIFSQEKFVEGPEREISNIFLFKKMPIPLLKMAGTLLYKHIG